LRRSLLKISDPLPPGHFTETDWQSLLAGYAAAPLEPPPRLLATPRVGVESDEDIGSGTLPGLDAVIAPGPGSGQGQAAAPGAGSRVDAT
jgi:hypothetical protein